MKILVVLFAMLVFVGCEKTADEKACEKATNNYQNFTSALINADMIFTQAKIAANSACALFVTEDRALDMEKLCDAAKKAVAIAQIGFDAAKGYADAAKMQMELSCKK